MYKSLLITVFGAILLIFNHLIAAPGEVAVSLETSVDKSIWSTTVEGVRNISTPPVYFRATIVPVDGGDVTFSNIFESSPPSPFYNVNLNLEKSTDLLNWSDAVVGTRDLSGGREFYRANANAIYNDMIYVEGGTMDDVPVEVDDFLICRYEVSKEEWDYFYDLAIVDDGSQYAFFEGLPLPPYGIGCAPNHPVSRISWYDTVKWCNARSEEEGFNPVYYVDSGLSTVYRQGNVDVLYLLDPSDSNPGYRLLAWPEWEYAARGGVNMIDTTYSGSNTLNEVATWWGNSSGAECAPDPPDPQDGTRGTWPIGTRSPNELGIFDMTGNIGEYVFVDEGLQAPGNRKVRILGGDYRWNFWLDLDLDGWSGAALTAAELPNFGFRVARTVPQVVSAAAESNNGKSDTVKKLKNSKF